MNKSPTSEQSSSVPKSKPITFLARGIEKNYEDASLQVEVLKGVDLQLNQGQMIAIVGASGTGKTTLLHILGTLDRPTKGSLTYNGEDVFKKDDTELSLFRNQMIGFVFQFHNLLPEFTALENVMMPGLIAGLDKTQVIDSAQDILAKVGLSHRFAHKIGELSGGEQQRVALARAVILKPVLLLADEPTGNLDTNTGNRVFQLLQEMSNTFSLTTVMATHNLDLAKRMDQCLILADGKLHE